MKSIFDYAKICLQSADIEQKLATTHEAWQKLQAGGLSFKSNQPVGSIALTQFPARPQLLPPRSMAKRNLNTSEGVAAMFHALAHIEFNAINLALDAIWRFPNLPEDYYKDWLKVAQEESYHFELLSNYLIGIGYGYGSFDAHNSLWEMVEKTKNDPLARMALVPRTMESRGLDALPLIRKRFIQINDKEMTSILEVILNDEVGHVEVGNRWFNYHCQQQGLDPIQAYADLVQKYDAPKLRGPFNYAARKAAGFTDAELAALDIHQ